jgi:hypothetical protein
MYFAAFLTVFWLLFVRADDAFAYVDPGSGGMIMQLLLGGVAGVAVLARMYWHRLLAVLGIKRHPDQE